MPCLSHILSIAAFSSSFSFVESITMLHLMGVTFFPSVGYDTPGIYLYDCIACNLIDHEIRMACVSFPCIAIAYLEFLPYEVCW